MKNFKLGFTLAEVLITLAIIGVVAALTIPTLLSNYQEKQYVTQLKKAYAVLQQAYTLTKAEFGESSTWSQETERPKISEDWLQKMSKHLLISEYCTNKPDAPKNCMGNLYKPLHSSDASINLNDINVSFVINNGTSVRMVIYANDCRYGESKSDFCGNIYVDLNGRNRPNQFGKDAFAFQITSDRVIPFGYEHDSPPDNDLQTYCNRKSTHGNNGENCTAWVIENENMDYLRCDDLSWDGKRRCSDKL